MTPPPDRGVCVGARGPAAAERDDPPGAPAGILHDVRGDGGGVAGTHGGAGYSAQPRPAGGGAQHLPGQDS